MALERIGNVRWYICALLFFATSVNYMDRQVLGILAPTLQHDIGWTEQQYSYIISAFQIAYAIGLVVAGRMVDRLGTRIGYAVIMCVWSLAAMAHALASSALGFGLARFLLGLGESGNFPAAVKTTAEWFPQRERSLATGIFNSGSSLGAILAPALVPIITLRFGWQAAFLAIGLVGVLWIIPWLSHYRIPAEHKRITPAEYEYIHRDVPLPAASIPWRRLLSYRQTWAFSIGKFMTDPIWWFYLYWLPKFFDSRFHLGLSNLGLPLIIVYNLSTVGSIGGGWLPAVLNRTGMTMVKARFAALLIPACLVLPIFFVGSLTTEWTAVAILGLATAAHQAWSANLYTTVSDMFPREAVGAVVGIGGMAGSVGGVLFSLGVGYLLAVTHSYTLLFAISASAYLVAFLIIRLLVPKLSRIDARVILES